MEHMSDLLGLPHHDGSPLYLDDEAPALGSHVGVRVLTPGPAKAVWLRSVEDGEPFFTACTSKDARWWHGQLHVRNEVTGYRFLIEYADTTGWLNAAGLFERDVPDAFDFTVSSHRAAPDWARDSVIYQIFPDRYARSAQADRHEVPGWARPAAWDEAPIHVGPDTPLQFYGGDLDGISAHLDHIERLGADTVYLTPVFPGESNHRYNASTFDEVDPLLGGEAAYRRLIDAVHERGWRIMGDFTSNHTGDTHEWFVAAADGGPERSLYYFEDDGSYEGWKGHGTLPKLDHAHPEVRKRIQEVVQRWLVFGLDGWRIDVANMTGRRISQDDAHRVAREIRMAATEIDQDVSIVGEHGHDASGDLDGDGWHGTMNYYGFSFPVWEFLRDPERVVPSFGLPVGITRRSGVQAMTSMREFSARFGWRAVQQSWNILGSHDSPRIRTTTGSAEMQRAAIAMQFTLPGVPMIFAGDELGLEGTDGEDSRKTMPWDAMPAEDLVEEYARWSRLRRDLPALTRGSMRWVHLGESVVVYLREHPEGDVLIAISRGGSPALTLPGDLPDVPECSAPTAFCHPLPRRDR